MAATANPSSNNLSPRYSSGDNRNSTQTRRAPTRAAPSPWTQIVRGESESSSAVPSSPSSPSGAAVHPEEIVPSPDFLPPQDSCSSSSPDYFPVENRAESSENTDGNSNAGKKPVWNKPSNGAVEVSPVMGAASWPALSESARVSARSLSDSSKAPAEGSSDTTSQGAGVGSSSPSKHKQATNNSKSNHNAAPKNSYPTRQRSFKRGGGNSIPNNVPSETPVIPGAGTETPQGNPSPRDHARRSTNWESGQRGPQTNAGHNGHPQHRSSFRRGNGGAHTRGDGSHHHSYGSRRDHDRGNHDWSPLRNFNGRDAHIHPQRGAPRGFVRTPPPPPPPFVPPPSVRPFSNPMGFEMAPSMVYIPPESFRGVPFFSPIPPHAMIFPSMDPILHAKIVSQIEYYFSNENLIKDTYLRQNMDEQGWVSIELIAGFNNVKRLTDNLQFILDALQTSAVVEVQADKVRRRNDWMRWIMPSPQYAAVSGFESPGRSSHDVLESRVQGVTLEETTNPINQSGRADVRAVASSSRSSSGNLDNQSRASEPAGYDQGAPPTGSEISIFSEKCK